VLKDISLPFFGGYVTIMGASKIALGNVPRVGPGRAIVFGFQSRLWSAPTVSQRSLDIKMLSQNIFQSTQRDERFMVLIGEKNIGKTCLLNTVLQHRFGVLRIKGIEAGTKSGYIVERACREIARTSKLVDAQSSARRVVRWYHFFFRRPPIVVIGANERPENQEAAELGQAARLLSDIGFRVVLDCSENAYYKGKLTDCEEFYEVSPMSNDVMIQLPEFKYLSELIKEKEMLQVLLAVCGGKVGYIIDCEEKLNRRGDRNVHDVVKDFVVHHMHKPYLDRTRFLKTYPDIKNVLLEFKTKQIISKIDAELLCGKDVLPDMKGVLREWAIDGETFLRPHDGAMALLLSGDFKSKPTYDEIKEVRKKIITQC